MNAATDPTDTRDALQRFKEAMLLEGKRSDGRGKWQCPAHDDDDPSLGVKHENGKVLLHCHSGGCTPEAIVAAIGLTMSDLFDEPLKRESKRSKQNGSVKAKRVADYPFTDRHGEPLSTHSRYEPGFNGKEKSFTWTNKNPHVLYNLPLIVDAEHVHINEGGKAADRLTLVLPPGHVATYAPIPGSWEPEFTDCLVGTSVTLWLDRDQAGLKNSAPIYAALTAAGIEVSIVQSKTTGAKDDAFDHLEAGFTIDEAVPMTPEELTASTDTSDSEKDISDAGAEWQRATGTESRTADLIVEQHKGDILYCRVHSRWYVFDGTRFARDTRHGDAILHRAEETAHSLYTRAAEAASSNNADAAEKYARWAKSAHSQSHLRGALSLARTRSEVLVEPEEFDLNPWLFNVENGTLDLHTGELRPHDRADRLTRKAPVTYDATAQCPKFMEYLERVMPDAATRSYLQRVAGTMLIGETPEEVMIFLLGYGANGKTVFTETVRGVLGGDYAAELAANALTIQSNEKDLARLCVPVEGKRLITLAELRDNQRLNEQAVKRLCSGEPMRIEYKYAESYEILPVATMIIATNCAPRIVEDNDGIWRRIHLVLWPVQIPKDEQDPHLRQKLAEERVGILNWMIEGCLAFQQQGLNPPDSVKNATANYREDEDILGAFLEDTSDETPDGWVLTADLNEALEFWHKRNHAGRPPSKRSLSNRLVNKGFKRDKKCGVRGWHGLSLKSEFRHEMNRTNF